MQETRYNYNGQTIDVSARNVPGESAYRACGINGTGFGSCPLDAISDYLEIVPLVHMRV